MMLSKNYVNFFVLSHTSLLQVLLFSSLDHFSFLFLSVTTFSALEVLHASWNKELQYGVSASYPFGPYYRLKVCIFTILCSILL